MPSRRSDPVTCLSCDAGSGSFKAALFDLRVTAQDPSPARWEGSIAWKRVPGDAALRSRWEGGRVSESHLRLERREDAPARLLRVMQTTAPSTFNSSDVRCAAHRIVHAGRLARSPAPVTPDVLRSIAEAEALAPEHNALALAGIEAAGAAFADARQFAVSDSAYHATLPAAASTYAVPASWGKVWGIHRLGFHGISHAYAAARCAHLMRTPLRSLRVVTCHLGNGCSLAATANGKSVDTTMGWTPLEGLVMATRSGSVDPGVVLYLLERRRYTAAELAHVLNEESGLRGLSGLSGDMRELLHQAAEGHPRAAVALAVYAHRLRAAIAAMAAAMDGLDALVFTGGVGENAHQVRADACAGLGFLGVKLDQRRNRQEHEVDEDIAARRAPVRTFVIRARETWAMARECARAAASAD